MVFSSLSSYLDPSNWQPQQPESGGEHENTQVSPLLQSPPPLTGGGGGGGGIGKPGTMADSSRLAKLPQPEIALKCPRCESTNTKFCYFNNYNLSQPRHFCKTCRRYWTRGGALRNVPVGGGCRRNNKRSKGGNRSKSPATSSPRISAVFSPNRCTTDNISHLALPPPKLPFFPSLHHLNTDHGAADVGLTFGGIQTATAGNDIDLINIGSNSQWRMQQMQQFSFLEAPTAGLMYDQYESEGPSSYARGVTSGDHFGSKTVESGVNQVDGGIKMEENHQGLNLSKRFLGISGTDHNLQFWGISNAWNSASEYASSSTNHVL